MNAAGEASIPHISMLASSSRGNSAVAAFGDDALLIDAGISAKRIKDSLLSIGCPIGSIKAVFITHEHTDHICGLEVLSKKLDVPIYAPEGCCADIMHSCPSTGTHLIPLKCGENIGVGHIKITAYPTPHDSAASVGYRVMFPNGDCLGYATDIGHITKDVVSILEGCRYAVVESNHDLDMLMCGPYPEQLKRRIAGDRGHLANQSITKMLPYLVKTGTRHIMLAHLSEENNTPERAFLSAKNALLQYGYSLSENKEGDVDLCVASPRDIVCF